MKTIFAKKENHIPKYFVLDAKDKTLGRLACDAVLLLRGKNTSIYSPGVDQGNFVIIINAEEILVSGKKEYQKLYFRSTQRPGGLKSSTFSQIKNRMPSLIIKKAILGMLPKNKLRKQYSRRLFIYSYKELNDQKLAILSEINAIWIKD